METPRVFASEHRPHNPPLPGLRADTIAEFKRDGHVRLAAVFRAPEISALDRALKEERAHQSQVTGDVDGSLARDAMSSRRSGEIAAFVRDPRLGFIAAQLLGTRSVRFIQDVLFEKNSTQSQTPWHRDSDFWSLTGVGALTLWIPLQNTSLSMSPLRFATGSHRATDPRPLRAIQKWGIPLRYRIASSALALGDATVHHYKTLHGAARNKEAGTARRSFAIHLIDGEAFVRSPRFQGQFEHAVACGWDRLRDGDRFTDDIAPLIWES